MGTSGSGKVRANVLSCCLGMSSSIWQFCWNWASSSWCVNVPLKAGSSGLASALPFGNFMCSFQSVSSKDPGTARFITVLSSS